MFSTYTGDVTLLDTIPFNYRERHPRLFDMSLTSKKSIYQMQQTNPSILLEPGVDDDLIVFGRAKCNTDDDRFYDPQCFSYEGSGDELITPMYTPPPRPKWRVDETDFNSNTNVNSNINPGGNVCDDDEDCRDSGSGVFFEGT